MLRIAVPYGELSSAQLRVLARIAREYDEPAAEVYAQPRSAGQARHAHGCRRTTPTSRRAQNVQFNWIPLAKAADVMDLLAERRHARHPDQRQLHPQHHQRRASPASRPTRSPTRGRSAKSCASGARCIPSSPSCRASSRSPSTARREDRAATGWHDIGLQLLKNDAGELGFQVLVGGGMGRTPVIGTVLREFLPWHADPELHRGDRPRLQPLRPARQHLQGAHQDPREGRGPEATSTTSRPSSARSSSTTAAPHTITQAELDRVARRFVPPSSQTRGPSVEADRCTICTPTPPTTRSSRAGCSATCAPHQNPALRAVTLSFKRLPARRPATRPPSSSRRAADLADRFCAGEARVTHDAEPGAALGARRRPARTLAGGARAGLASANIGLLTDMIACPGGDFCALANARSIPIAEAITERYQDLDELDDIGEIDLHISGCINSCGHHHSGHIGILGVDKDGKEWYQVTLGGSDGSVRSGAPQAGKVIGPSFAAAKCPTSSKRCSRRIATFETRRTDESPSSTPCGASASIRSRRRRTRLA